ncbi:MAG: hypothetical protein AAF752_08495 [Bacteroidota bacterium]
MSKRRGIWIKNVSEKPVRIRMANRSVTIRKGDVRLISAEEVRDKTLREHLQVRSVAIVRPATAEEEAEEFNRAIDED